MLVKNPNIDAGYLIFCLKGFQGSHWGNNMPGYMPRLQGTLHNFYRLLYA